jgi:hypothetical protein
MLALQPPRSSGLDIRRADSSCSAGRRRLKAKTGGVTTAQSSNLADQAFRCSPLQERWALPTVRSGEHYPAAAIGN